MALFLFPFSPCSSVCGSFYCIWWGRLTRISRKPQLAVYPTFAGWLLLQKRRATLETWTDIKATKCYTTQAMSLPGPGGLNWETFHSKSFTNKCLKTQEFRNAKGAVHPKIVWVFLFYFRDMPCKANIFVIIFQEFENICTRLVCVCVCIYIYIYRRCFCICGDFNKDMAFLLCVFRVIHECL